MAAVVLLMAAPGRALVRFWDGGAPPAGLDGYFGNNLNWSPDGVPGAGDDVSFDTGSATAYDVYFSTSPTTHFGYVYDTLRFREALAGATYTLGDHFYVTDAEATLEGLDLTVTNHLYCDGVLKVREGLTQGRLVADRIYVGTNLAYDGLISVSGNAHAEAPGGLALGWTGHTGEFNLDAGATATVGVIGVADSSVADSEGYLRVRGGSTMTAGNLYVASIGAPGQTAELLVQDTGSVFALQGGALAYLGAPSGGTATVHVSQGTFTTGTGTVYVQPTATVLVDGGGTLDLNGNLEVNGGLVDARGGTLAPASGLNLDILSGGRFLTDQALQLKGWDIDVIGGGSRLVSTADFDQAGGSLHLSGGAHMEAERYMCYGVGGSPCTAVLEDAGTDFDITGTGSGLRVGVLGEKGVLTVRLDADLTCAGPLSICDSSYAGSVGTLTVESGGSVAGARLAVGTGGQTGQSGTVTVTGLGSHLNVSAGPAVVGAAASSTGTLSIKSSGSLRAGSLTVHPTGTVSVGSSAILDVGTDVLVDGGVLDAAAGALWLADGHHLTVGGGGRYADGMLRELFGSTVTVTGAGTEADFLSGLRLRGGALEVSDGALLEGSWFSLSGHGGTPLNAVVEGAGTTLATTNVASSLAIGQYGEEATLTLRDGAACTAAGDLVVGAGTGTSRGILRVESGATAAAAGHLTVGSMCDGILWIEGGGQVASERGLVASRPGSAGTVALFGTDSAWHCTESLVLGGTGADDGGNAAVDVSSTGHLYVGDFDPAALGYNPSEAAVVVSGAGPGGHLLLRNGALLNVDGVAVLSGTTGETGTATLSGPGTLLQVTEDLFVGGYGHGVLAVSDGAAIDTERFHVGRFGGSGTSSGEALFDGGTLDVATFCRIGVYGDATLDVRGGSHITTSDVILADGTGVTAHATLDDSTWGSGLFTVGDDGAATLQISGGSTVTTAYGYIGRGTSADGTVSVTGPGTTWTCSTGLYVGGYSTLDGGTGVLNIAGGGHVDVGDLLRLWDGATVHLLAGGRLTAASIDHTRGGTFTFTGGVLTAGFFLGDLVCDGGTIAPGGSPGRTDISGALQIASGTLAIELAGTSPSAPCEFDQVTAGGTAVLGGTLALDLDSGFVPAYGDTFRILSAAGRLGIFAQVDGALQTKVLGLATVYDTTGVDVVAALPGDANLDGIVDTADYFALSGAWYDPGKTWVDGDFTGDGTVTTADYFLLAGNWYRSVPTTAPAPEPATLALVALGALAILNRR